MSWDFVFSGASGGLLDLNSCLSRVPVGGNDLPMLFSWFSMALGQLVSVLELAQGSGSAGIVANPSGWRTADPALPVIPHTPGSCWQVSPAVAVSSLPVGTIPQLLDPPAPGEWEWQRIPSWDGGKVPHWRRFGAQGGHRGGGGATQAEGTTRGRKYLAELKFLAEDQFWAEVAEDLHGNIGNIVLEREKSSAVTWGFVSPLAATCQALSQQDKSLVPSGGFMSPHRLVLPLGCCQAWQWEGNSLERGVTWVGKRNTAAPVQKLLKKGRRANKGRERSVP